MAAPAAAAGGPLDIWAPQQSHPSPQAAHSVASSGCTSHAESAAQSLPQSVQLWWRGVPLGARAVLAAVLCVYAGQVVVGGLIADIACLRPEAVVLQYQVWRVFTSPWVHGGLWHVVFNLLAFVPVAAALEHAIGIVRFLHTALLLAFIGAVLYIAMAFIPFVLLGSRHALSQCAVGLSGVVFGLLVVEQRVAGRQQCSIFGLFNMPAALFPWALLVLCQVLVPHASLLGHLGGLLAGELQAIGSLSVLQLSDQRVQWMEGGCAACCQCGGATGCVTLAQAAAGGTSGLPITMMPAVQDTPSAKRPSQLHAPAVQAPPLQLHAALHPAGGAAEERVPLVGKSSQQPSAPTT